LFHGGNSVDLGTLGGPFATAVDINDKGQIVGASGRAAGEGPRAWIWEDGKMTEIPTPAGARSGASDINNNGAVVGSWAMQRGRRHAFVATPCPAAGCPSAPERPDRPGRAGTR
jgi:probable HAF family extracellular repeat protein